MNKMKGNQKVVVLILFLVIPILASIISKVVFYKINQEGILPATNIKGSNKISRNINAFTIYSIQVGSLSSYEKVKLVEKDLDENQIPNYIVKKDGFYKIYSYTFLDENQIKPLLDGVKENYKDAFIAKIKVSGLNIEYTGKYSYMEDIQKNLALMLKTMEKESIFWSQYNLGKCKYEDYITIVNEKKKIVDSLTKNSMDINDEEVQAFKEKLQEFSKKYQNQIDGVNVNLANNNMYSCEKIFLNTVFEYYFFIKSLK